MSKHPFTGLGVALVTPFTDDNKIDYKSLERLLEHLLRDQAMDFLVVHGTTGESPCLTRPEREAVTRRVVDQVAGRCPIMVGLGGNDTVETGERIQAMDTHGVSGILSVVPYYNKPSQEGIFQHFSYLPSAVNSRSSSTMSPDESGSIWLLTLSCVSRARIIIL